MYSLILFFPLVGFISGSLFGLFFGFGTCIITTFLIFCTFLMSLKLFFSVVINNGTYKLYFFNWFSNDNLNIISDNYKIFDDDELNALVMESLSGTPYDIAGVLHYMYKDQFVYSSKTQIWYKFDNHFWKIADDLELKKNISTTLYDIYKNLM